jgi:hypothetical protein
MNRTKSFTLNSTLFKFVQFFLQNNNFIHMKRTINLLLLILTVGVFTSLKAQQQESYTFCVGSSYSYLLDTTTSSTSTYYGRWTTGSTSYVAHFQKDTIYQTSGTGSGGGSYGSVKKWACTSTTTATAAWTYAITGAHHDICPLPNGNVLVIVSESKTSAQIIAAGGTYTGTGTFEKIQEIHPTGATTGTVVWEWKLWDHICQTSSSTKPNYVTSVALNPQLFNIAKVTSSDFFHLNGIDYNPTLDQIVFSSHMMNEVFIIDHSTSATEVATHAGGNAGKGGDFLYRWGSPANYGCTAGGNGITLNTIHDVRWVSATNAKYPNYISMFHNNGGGTVQSVLFLPPHSTSDPYNYTFTPGSIIGPTTCTKPTIPSITGVTNQGGNQVLENGNILITKPGNTYYECNGSGTTYQTISVGTVQADRLKKCDVLGPFNPAATTSSATTCINSAVTLSSSATSPIQGASPSYTYSWSSTPAGFTSTSQNPTVTPTVAGTYTYVVTVTTGGCSSTASVSLVADACTGIEETASEKTELNLFPNPTSGVINLNEDFSLNNNYDIIVYNSFGEVVIHENNSKIIDLSMYTNGIYYITVKSDNNNVINKKVILIK